MKYVGMSSKPYYRLEQWGKKRDLRNFEIVNDKPLNYKKAQILENTIASDRKCPDCESHAGGWPVPGDVYYVYTYDY